MARKSRKNTMDVATVVQDQTVRAAIYIRLSVEDRHTGSISIETQRMIIDSFIEREPDIMVYDTYIDNGLTGTTFAEVR